MPPDPDTSKLTALTKSRRNVSIACQEVRWNLSAQELHREGENEAYRVRPSSSNSQKSLVADPLDFNS